MTPLSDQLPKVSFGIIVLNGEPFLPYCLRALYPLAHQILVVEGAVPAAAGVARVDGHSSDGTLENLRRFKREEDPQDKIQILTAEDLGHTDGFWPGEKDQMSAAYAERATGDYLWQIDSDEFYDPTAMRELLAHLQKNHQIHTVSFPMLTFWGGFDTLTDGWYLRRGAAEYHRLFRWGSGFRYRTHRPPTVVDAQGRDLRELGWMRASQLRARSMFLYHYSLVFPKQVREKCQYYAQASWAQREGATRWAEDCFIALRDPYHVHNVYQYPSWLERFRGVHPPQISRLIDDIRSGRISVEERPSADVQKLLTSLRYRIGRTLLRLGDRPGRWLDVLRHYNPLRRWRTAT